MLCTVSGGCTRATTSSHSMGRSVSTQVLKARVAVRTLGILKCLSQRSDGWRVWYRSNRFQTIQKKNSMIMICLTFLASEPTKTEDKPKNFQVGQKGIVQTRFKDCPNPPKSEPDSFLCDPMEPPAVMDSSRIMDTTISGVPTLDPETASLPVRRPSNRMAPAPPLDRMPMYTMPQPMFGAFEPYKKKATLAVLA